MDFEKLINLRSSVRQYKSQKVERDLLEKVLNAGRLAPSAVNFQPWEFIVIREEENLKVLAECYHREWFKTAPCVIVVCGNHHDGWHRKSDGKDHTNIDVAIAVDHMTLQAAELSLGTCWVCNFDPHLCSQALKLPPHIEPIVMLPIGFPDEKARLMSADKKRKDLVQIVHWETYAD